MLNKIARGAFLLLLAGMIVAWAFQAVKSEPQVSRTKSRSGSSLPDAAPGRI